MPESSKKLDEIYRLAKQNNKMLRSMKRAAFWGTVFKIVLYAALLGIPLYLYFTIFQPIMEDLGRTYSQVQQAGVQLQGVTDSIPLDQLQGLLDSIPGVDFSGTPQ